MFSRKNAQIQREPKGSVREVDDDELEALLKSVAPTEHQGYGLHSPGGIPQFEGLSYNPELLTKQADTSRRSEHPQVELVSNDAAEKPNMGIRLVRPLPDDQARAMGDTDMEARVPIGQSPQMGSVPSWDDTSKSLEQRMAERLEFVRRHGIQQPVMQTVQGPMLGQHLNEHIARVDAASSVNLESSGQVPVFKSDPQASGSMMGHGGAQVANKQASQDDLWAELSKTAAPKRAPAPAQRQQPAPQALLVETSKLQPFVLELNNLLGSAEWVGWEFETIQQLLGRAGVMELPQVSKDKISAIKLVLSSGAFFTNARAFEKVCVALSHRAVDYSSMQTVKVEQMAAAVALVSTMRAPEEWSSDVCGYVAATAWDQGWNVLPEVLDFATPDLMNISIRSAGDQIVELTAQTAEALGHLEHAINQSEEAVLDLLLSAPEHVAVQCFRHLRLIEYIEREFEGMTQE